MNKNFSIRRAIMAQINETRQETTEAEIIRTAEARHSAAVGTPGGIVIPLEKRGYTAIGNPIRQEKSNGVLLPFLPNLVLSKVGARIMTDLQKDVFFGEHTEIKSFWEGENDPAQDGAGSFSKGRVFSPKRLTSHIDVSKQLLTQDSQSVDVILSNMITTAIAVKVEEAAFSASAGLGKAPDGIFANANSMGDLNWENIVRMETDIDTDSALMGNLAYITHPALIGSAKTKTKDVSGAGGFIVDNNTLNGYNLQRTVHVPDNIGDNQDEKGIVFGNWADYFLGQWGGVEIITDKYTFALQGMVRLTVHSYWDMGVIRPESFSIISMR